MKKKGSFEAHRPNLQTREPHKLLYWTCLISLTLLTLGFLIVMKIRGLHIILFSFLLFAYGAEQLLPCTGEWDIDCHEQKEQIPSPCEESDHSDQNHSHDSDSHADHQCVCPCHAPVTPVAIQTSLGLPERSTDYGLLHMTLLIACLSPPDHIPIG